MYPFGHHGQIADVDGDTQIVGAAKQDVLPITMPILYEDKLPFEFEDNDQES